MKNYFDSLEKKDCNGCGICFLKCPKNAITMQEDGEGFLYPIIDKEKCINCGLCKRICSNNEPKSEYITKSFIAINKDDDVKRNSSSGGMFPIIAKHIIKQGGVVFGVAYDENLIAHHQYTEKIEELKKFQNSKYVRSDLGNSYKLAKKFISEGRYVLFSGTPCQCAGIRNFINEATDKLITCEIICHANPSPKVFELYKKNIEMNQGKKIKNVRFRFKENGWKNQVPIIELEDGSKINDNTYYKAFVAELINRPSCYSCRFSSPKRYSDFTIGDFWGIDKIDSSIEDNDTGISVLCVNSNNGMNILNQVKDELFLKEVDTSKAFKYNHNSNVEVNANREKFFSKIVSGEINENNVIKYMRKLTPKRFDKRVISKIKRIINHNK